MAGGFFLLIPDAGEAITVLQDTISVSVESLEEKTVTVADVDEYSVTVEIL